MLEFLNILCCFQLLVLCIVSHLLCINVLIYALAVLLLQLWNLKPGWGSRPDVYVEKAHSDDITGLKFSSDGQILLSRSFDGSLKVVIYVFRTSVFFFLCVYLFMLNMC